MVISRELLLLLLPLVVIHYSMAAIALVDLIKRSNYPQNKKLLWGAMILFVQIFGPIIYYVFGRKDYD